jgi:hypothetical protein
MDLNIKYFHIRKDIFNILIKSQIGMFLAYISQFAPEIRECRTHTYLNLICQKR